MNSFLAPGDIYFDIGANIGNTAENYIVNDVKTVLVEPQPQCIAKLHDRFSLNKNVEIIEAAVGSQTAKLPMKINTLSPTISTLNDQWLNSRFKDLSWDKEIVVDVITIDHLVSEFGKPRYIKIDVEGYELEVLKGLSEKVGVISFEFTSEFIETTRECLDYLKKLGYTWFNFKVGTNDFFALKSWSSTEEVIEMLNLLITIDPLLWGDIYAN